MDNFKNIIISMSKPSANRRFIWSVILVILFSLLGWFVIYKTVSPLTQINDQLATQVESLLHPTPTILPDPITIINEVRAVARLETIHYSVEKVVTAETGQGLLEVFFGDRLLFVGHGVVIAGLDLSKIEADDLWLDVDELHVRLPAAEVFLATLDNDRSYVYDREVGILKDPDPTLETLARQVAEEEILKAALEDGILEQARLNAETYLHKFFNLLGYDRVVFSASEP